MVRSSSFLLAAVASAAALSACGGKPPAPPRTASHEASAPAERKQNTPAFSSEAIDAALREAWQRDSLTAAPRADDATFVRRAYLDVVGTIPTPEETTAFVSSKEPDKRKKLIDALLASAPYAEHWMNYWDDVLMGREVKGPIVDRVAFRYWLRARFEANAPWDRIVRDLVSATGQNSIGGARVRLPQAMAMTIPLGTSVPRKGDDDAADLEQINGAVNWTLRFEQTPQDLAGNASRIFLGVQIQCAQCHDHKTEKWKQEDFRRFTACFVNTRPRPSRLG